MFAPNDEDRSAEPDDSGDTESTSRPGPQVEDEARIEIGFGSMLTVQTSFLVGGLGLGLLLGLTGDRNSGEGSAALWSASWWGAGWAFSLLSGVLIACLMLVAVWQLQRMGWAWLIEIEALLQRVLVPSLQRCSVGQLAVIALIAGVGEELCFRWALQGGVELGVRNLGNFLRVEYGFAALDRPDFLEAIAFFVAAATVSLVFGAFHAVTRAYFWIASLMGFGFALLAGFGGGLVGAMLAHGLYDFLAFLWLCQRWPFVESKRVADSR